MLTPPGRETRAALMLLLATAFWGLSFTWIKAAGAGLNDAAGEAAGSPFGPVFVLSVRFTVGALLWLIFDGASRRGWSLRSIGHGAVLGSLIWLPMLSQVFGLDRTSEAVSAFLTSLTVIFVPLILTVVFRQPPPGIVWVAVAIASAGIWLMTGATPTGFGVGEAAGLLCAVGFSAHIIAYNRLIGRESVPRMTVAQFALTGLGSWALAFALRGADVVRPGFVSAVLSHGREDVVWTSVTGVLGSPWVALNIAFAVVVSTLLAFGIVFRFQPRVSPTRAALVYVAEPVVAAAFAYVAVGRTLALTAVAGAALILMANVVVDVSGWLKARFARGR